MEETSDPRGTSGKQPFSPRGKTARIQEGRDDENRCKFFKWADELDDAASSSNTASSSKAARLVNTLGQEPRSLVTPTKPKPPIYTPQSAPRPEPEEIDWDSIDTESMEKAAIASTPVTSQQESQTPTRTPFQSRLLEAVEDGRRDKRKRESTPERPEVNPFASSPGFTSPPHHFLTGTLDSLNDLSEHIHRQDRLLAAADKAKEGFRKTIRGLQERNGELEARVKELEAQLKP